MFDTIEKAIAQALEHFANKAHVEAEALLTALKDKMATEKAAAEAEAAKIMAEAKAKVDAIMARFQ